MLNLYVITVHMAITHTYFTGFEWYRKGNNPNKNVYIYLFLYKPIQRKKIKSSGAFWWAVAAVFIVGREVFSIVTYTWSNAFYMSILGIKEDIVFFVLCQLLLLFNSFVLPYFSWPRVIFRKYLFSLLKDSKTLLYWMIFTFCMWHIFLRLQNDIYGPCSNHSYSNIWPEYSQ